MEGLVSCFLDSFGINICFFLPIAKGKYRKNEKKFDKEEFLYIMRQQLSIQVFRGDSPLTPHDTEALWDCSSVGRAGPF